MMYEIDLDRFKALKPWRDASFWIAIAATALALVPTEVRVWITTHRAALAPLLAWLVIHGAVRVSGALALGKAVAGSRYVDVKGDRLIDGTVPTLTGDEAESS